MAKDRKPQEPGVDVFHTPDRLALAMSLRVATLLCSDIRRVVEPSAGRGAFIRASKKIWPDAAVVAVDTEKAFEEYCTAAGAKSFVVNDWMKQDVSRWHPDLIIGNPPYSLAEDHVAHALRQLDDGKSLAFLLPIYFLCSKGRVDTLWCTPPPFGNLRYFTPIRRRPSFTAGGTARAEYAIYIWTKGFDSFPMMTPHLDVESELKLLAQWNPDGADVGERKSRKGQRD